LCKETGGGPAKQGKIRLISADQSVGAIPYWLPLGEAPGGYPAVDETPM